MTCCCLMSRSTTWTSRLESFERCLSAFEGTVLVVVHDRYSIRRSASALWVVGEGTVRRVADVYALGARYAAGMTGSIGSSTSH
jgi:ATPase subunit of ABC transporter with duplicated ATPase domains